MLLFSGMARGENYRSYRSSRVDSGMLVDLVGHGERVAMWTVENSALVMVRRSMEVQLYSVIKCNRTGWLEMRLFTIGPHQ